MKVCDLPLTDRPLYRLSNLGGNYLSNVELLALVIGTEQSIVLAQQLFTKFKSLESIHKASIQELTSIKGIGKNQAGKILASLEISPRLVLLYPPTAITQPKEIPIDYFFLVRITLRALLNFGFRSID